MTAVPQVRPCWPLPDLVDVVLAHHADVRTMLGTPLGNRIQPGRARSARQGAPAPRFAPTLYRVGRADIDPRLTIGRANSGGPAYAKIPFAVGGPGCGVCRRRRGRDLQCRDAGAATSESAPVAQGIEPSPSKRLVAGSSPAWGATDAPDSNRAVLIWVTARTTPHGPVLTAHLPPLSATAASRCPSVTRYCVCA